MAVLSRQRGVALIIVLLIVALVTVLATQMGSRLQLQVKRASNIKDSNQAYWYAMGAEQFARKAIKELIDADEGVITLEQPWNEEFTYPLEGGGIQAQLIDAHSCFNVNALGQGRGDDGAVREVNEAFSRLLTSANLEIDDYAAQTFRDSLADWIDADSDVRDYGAEDSEYESLVQPYIAANSEMVNKSELRLINGVDAKWINELMPLVCVLPGETKLSVNVNTITEDNAAVLSAVTGLSQSAATAQINSRGNKGYDKIEDFLEEQEIRNLELNDTRKSWLTVKSEHFILHTKTRYNDARFSMVTLFKVKDKQVSVISREFGGIK